METIIIKVNTKSSKAKQLFSLIRDMVNDGDVKVEKSSIFNEVKKGIKEIKDGKVKPIEELFK